jgi:type II secretory pathway component GspD/PulD (secretin)
MRLGFVSRLALVAASLLWAASGRADELTFGKVSMAVEKAVADKIGLSDELRGKLQDLIKEQEDAALELANEIKELPADEKKKKEDAFVAAVEKKGLELLTDEQKAALEKVRIGRAGMATLTEPAIVKQLALTDEQKEKIAGLMKERDEQIAAAPDNRSIVVSVYERKLANILTADQKAKWDAMAGVQPGEGSPKVAGPGGERPGPGGERPGRNGSGGSTTRTTPEKTVEPPATVRTKVSPDGKMSINFRYAAWKDVLDWYAQQADLALEGDVIPPGTCNYTDNKRYTAEEALDVLNGILLWKGYTLVQRGRMLIVVHLEDAKMLVDMADQVDEKDLNNLGKTKVVGCWFNLDKFAPEEAELEVKKFLGPMGQVRVSNKARQILVVETVDKLRMIKKMIDRVENPEASREEKLSEIVLHHASVDDIMPPLRELLGMPPERNATPDGAVRILPDSLARRLIINTKPDRLAKIEEIVKLLDVDAGETTTDAPPMEHPQVEIYKLGNLDPTVVLAVMQTMLAELPDVRLTVDTKAGTLIAQARPAQHATIAATLAEMSKDKSDIKVIVLHRVDPQLAVLTINKLMGGGEGGDAHAPKVDADPTTRQLIIKGTKEQIAQIESLLKQMGEGAPVEQLTSEEKGNVRTISGRNLGGLIDQMHDVWPVVRKNPIRIVTPSRNGSTSGPREYSAPHDEPLDEEDAKPMPEKHEKPKLPPEAKSTRRDRVVAHFAAYQAPTSEEKPADKPATEKKPADKDKPDPEKKPSKPGAEIIVTVTPNSVIIASEDLEALDDFESMLRELIAGQPVAPGSDLTVIKLKYAKAEVAASLLQEMLGAGGGESAGGGGGNFLGGLIGSAIGGPGGDLLGGLLGGGGEGGGTSSTIATSGKVTIIPDPRLNWLLVQAGPSDTMLIETLVNVIDREHGLEDVQTQPKPRLIPLEHITAAEAAQAVRDTWPSRVAAAGGGNQQQRQPSPEEFIRALRGGGRGQGGNQRQRGEETKMTVAIDARSNSLIVSAPDPLFREVEALVKELDKADSANSEYTQVMRITNVNPELIKTALAAHLGSKATVNTSTMQNNTQQATLGGAPQGGNRGGQGQGQRGGQGGQRGGGQGQAGGGDIGQFFQALQQAGGGGGGRGGGRGGQGGGGGGRGGGGGGRGGGGFQ